MATVTAWYKSVKLADGSFPAHAFPGGYPIIYIATDEGVFCANCMNTEEEIRLTRQEGWPEDGWTVLGFDLHMEGPPEYCCHCNAEIESAYGDPEEESK
jgi:hypothetical protein